MAFESAYAVDGSRVPASMLRRDKYQSSGGARGITLPTDLRVTATGTPSGSVNISRGSGVAPSPWRPGESYMVANSSADLFDIPATGSAGGRTEYIVVKVRDHHYDGGQAPEDPLVDSYTEIVRVASLSNLSYPYVPLAKLTIPASTATITNSMITDIREVANPRSKRVIRSNPLVTSETESLTATGTIGEWWPNAGGMQEIFVPSWATRFTVTATWHSILMPATNSWGRIWVNWGDLLTPQSYRELNTQEFSFNTPGGTGATAYTADLSVTGDHYIPAKYRDRNVIFTARGRKDGGGNLVAAWHSGYSIDITFLEVADLSTT